MNWTLADHYADDEPLPIGDARQFDGDLRRLFARRPTRRRAKQRRDFLARHEGELVARIAYWAGVGPGCGASLLRALARAAGDARAARRRDWRRRR